MRMTLIEKIVLGMIAATVICLIAVAVVVGPQVVKLNHDVESRGLKGVLSDIWNGNGNAESK